MASVAPKLVCVSRNGEEVALSWAGGNKNGGCEYTQCHNVLPFHKIGGISISRSVSKVSEWRVGGKRLQMHARPSPRAGKRRRQQVVQHVGGHGAGGGAVDVAHEPLHEGNIVGELRVRNEQGCCSVWGRRRRDGWSHSNPAMCPRLHPCMTADMCMCGAFSRLPGGSGFRDCR